MGNTIRAAAVINPMSNYSRNNLSGHSIDSADDDKTHHSCTAVSPKENVCVSCVVHQKMPGIIWPVVAYAPMAATTPNMAAQPLMRSAFSFICFLQSVVVNYDSTIFVGEY